MKAFEERVWPSITSTFGEPPDVDGNRQAAGAVTHELGRRLNGGWLIGYFGNADLVRSRDDSPDCSSGGSNHGEIVYLNDPRAGGENVMRRRSCTRGCTGDDPPTSCSTAQFWGPLRGPPLRRPEDLDHEALSKVAEDRPAMVGTGGGRSEGRPTAPGGGSCAAYDGRSLTHWEGTPSETTRARQLPAALTDRMGRAWPLASPPGPGRRAGLESALDLPLRSRWRNGRPRCCSRTSQARPTLLRAAWSAAARPAALPGQRRPSARLRRDGIAAVMSGPGLAAARAITVRSGSRRRPHVSSPG